MRRILLSTLLIAGSAFAQRVEVEGRAWLIDSTLKAKIKAPVLATEVDFKKDLGVTDSTAPDLRVTYFMRGHSFLRFGYVQDSWDADANVTRTVEFSNRTYTVGTRVVTHYDFKQIRLSYANQFIHAASDKFRFGVLVEGYGIQSNASLRAPALNVSAEDNRWVGFPTAGLIMNIRPVKKAEVFVEGAGMSLGKWGYTTNFEAGGRIVPVRFLSVSGGYRLNRINPKMQSDYATVILTGPFVGASIRF